MTTAAIYARFSTELQNDRSAEDQITLCRQYADREGLVVSQVFADKAKSGASTNDRDALLAMLNQCYAGHFKYIIVEALDRLSRDMEDLAAMYKRLTYAGVEIRAVHEGKANTVMIGLRGLVGQLFREDNVHKVRRGMSGLVDKGLSAGGRGYGFRPDPMNKGRLLQIQEEVEVIRRIFREVASGKSSLIVSRELNRDNIPPPRGTVWSPSTIHGSLDRGYGILHNRLYIGEIVWNKVRMVKDPDTGKRLSRANPQSEWKVKAAPEYRIVDQETWDACHRKERKKMLKDHRRPKRLLSGLLRCGCCGSGMALTSADRSGRVRVACTAGKYSQRCAKPVSFYAHVIEDLVLSTIVEELQNPKLIARYLKTYHEERVRLNKELERERALVERRLIEANKRLDALIDMAVSVGSASMKTKVEEASKACDALRDELEQIPEPAQEVAFNQNLMRRYADQLVNLRDTLSQGLKAGDLPVNSAIRDLIHSVTVYRDAETNKPRVVIQGTLNVLVGSPDKTLTLSSLRHGAAATNGHCPPGGGAVEVVSDCSGSGTQT